MSKTNQENILPNGRTHAGLTRTVLGMAQNGGVSVFVIEGNYSLGNKITDMLASGEILPVESRYPWVGFKINEGK